MRALNPSEGRYLPPRGTYVSVVALVLDYGYGFTMIDHLVRSGRFVWVGSKFLVT